MKGFKTYFIIMAGLMMARQSVAQVKERFSHELRIGYGAVHAANPDLGWKNNNRSLIIPEYQFGYRDRFFFKFRYIGKWSPGDAFSSVSRDGLFQDFWWRSQSLSLHAGSEYAVGEILQRHYQLFDFIPSYKILQYGSFSVLAGVGVAYRKGWDEYVSAIEDNGWIEVFPAVRPVNTLGYAAEVSATYHFREHFTASATFTYRNYSAGDPVLSGTVSIGYTLRH